MIIGFQFFYSKECIYMYSVYSTAIIPQFARETFTLNDILILKDYWPSVRSVPWNIGLRFFSTDRAIAASEVRTKKTEVRYFMVQTEQARSINCLLYGYSIFPVAAAILHL